MSNSSVEIRSVQTKADLKLFIDFPYDLYKNCEYWVPPLKRDEWATLDRQKNPAFEYCEASYWLAYIGSRVVGRIAAIFNERYVETWGNRFVRFGYVDFIDDFAVSAALFRAAEDWGRVLGCTAIHGPLGFTDLDEEGMLVEGFDELGTLPMIYNYAYYPDHLERMGYDKDIDWLEYRITVPDEIPDRVVRLERIVRKRTGARLLPARRSKDFLPYVPQIFDVINAAYAPLYGVVELTDAQVESYTKQYFDYIDPRYTKVVLDSRDRVIAFVVAMPSLSRALQKSGGTLFPLGFVHLLRAMRNPDTIDLYLGAVRPEYQNSGVSAILLRSLVESCIRNGVTHAESSGNLETNVKVRELWKYFEHRRHKRRRIYIRSIDHVEPPEGGERVRAQAL
jgi:GNAT superfamily N-acetyltransferase